MAVKSSPVVAPEVGLPTAAKWRVSIVSVAKQVDPATSTPWRHSTAGVAAVTTLPVRSTPVGTRNAWSASRVMSKPLRALDPETTTATLTEEPVVAGIETGGVAHVVEPLGPKQSRPAA